MELRIDTDRCTGHGRCYALAPDLFEPDDAGRGVVRVPTVAPTQLEAARAAVDGCPEAAITLLD